MNFYTIITGLTTFLIFVLGVMVYLKNPRSLLHKIWFTFSFSVSVWGFGYFLTLTAWLPHEASLWCSRFSHASGAFIPILFFDFVSTLLSERKTHKKFIRYGYIISVLLYVASFTPLIVKDVVQKLNIAYYPEGGILYPLYAFMYYVYAGYGMYRMYYVCRHSDTEKSNQLKYFLIASFIGFAGGFSLFFLILNIKIPPYASILMGLYPILTSYGILRHKFMGIEVIIKKTLVFAGLLASVLAILVLPALLFQEFVFRNAGIGGRILGLTISGIIIIFTVRRIEDFLIKITDKYLFQKKYDYKELLKTFTSEVLTVLDLNKLIDLTVDKLSYIIKLNSCAVLLFDNEKQQFDVRASLDIKDPRLTLSRPDEIVSFLDNTHGYLLRADLRDQQIDMPSSVQEAIDALSSELIIPMILHEKIIGMLSLGKKKSDEGYTQDDLDILLPLARTLAIAISNAELFEELGKTQAEAAQKEKMAVIGTLSAGINHEICNPLGIARGQCEAFLLNVKDGIYKDKSPQELMQKAEAIMNKVIKETDRATAITKKLSSFAKPAKGEAELVDINKEVDEVLGLVGYELKLEKIEFDKSLNKDLPGILVDRKQFQEVLFNLIRNAGQAIGEKGKISISAKEEKGKVIIDIQDTGSGIPENKIKELFNPFFTTKEPGKGTGLGLFIVRQVVEKNGGKIYLKRTKVGEGTTFTIEFPAFTQGAENKRVYETADSRNRR